MRRGKWFRPVLSLVASAFLGLAGASSAAAAGPAIPFDFDGNGYADLPIAAPSEDLGKVEDGGGVNVLYAGPDGLSAAGNQFWSQDSAGIGGHADPGDSFGAAIASGDFDRDGHADLVVGARESGRGKHGAVGGAVNVIYGSGRGLTARGNQHFSQETPGFPSRGTRSDGFGGTLATGDLDGDGYADLAIGAPMDYRAPEHEAQGYGRIGSVTVLYGSASGLRTAGLRYLTQDSPGVQGAAEADDGFGRSLVVADFTGDGRDDLVIGVPGENMETGIVQILPGSATGVTATGDQVWSLAGLGLAREGTFREEEWFGGSLSAGDFDGDGQPDLAIAANGEPIEEGRSGAVHVLYGAGSGLTAARSQLWHRGADGVAAEPADINGDGFAAGLTTGDFDADGRDDLAIASTRTMVSSRVEAGAVHVLDGGPGGLTATGMLIGQDSPGVPGTAEDREGASLTITARRSGDGIPDDLLIGWPDEALGAEEAAGMVIQIPGSSAGPATSLSRAWTQDSPGIRGTVEAFDLFGRLAGG